VRVHGAEPRVQEDRVADAQRDPQARQDQRPEADQQLGEQRGEAAEREPKVQGQGVPYQLRGGSAGGQLEKERARTQRRPVEPARIYWVGGLVGVGLKIGAGGAMAGRYQAVFARRREAAS
jgi:hypothetical protein